MANQTKTATDLSDLEDLDSESLLLETLEAGRAAGIELDPTSVAFALGAYHESFESSNAKAKDNRLPVTVLSGFLGAGKTTLLQRILNSTDHGLRVAVIVNDMAALNVDAQAVVKVAPKLVSMQNGCICCTLREDLLEQVSEIAKAGEWDYLVIESTGISEPLPVAQTFVMDLQEQHEHEDESEDEFAEMPLEEDGVAIHHGIACDGSDEYPLRGIRYSKVCSVWDLNATEFAKLSPEEQRAYEIVTHHGATPVPVHAATAKALREAYETKKAAEAIKKAKPQLLTLARLDTMVTVVDSVTFFERLSTLELVKDQPDADGTEEEERTLSDLMVDQVEFADVILVNKTDKASPAQLSAVEAFIKKLNPVAKVIRTCRSNVPLENILNTHLFDMDEAQTSAGWLRELNAPAHTPETIEYGVGSVIFRASRPFHPVRLHTLLSGIGSADMDKRVVEFKKKSGDKPEQKRRKTDSSPLAGVLRSKGQIWLANAYGIAFTWHSAGRMHSMVPEGAFIARVLETELGVARIGEAFSPSKGDTHFDRLCQAAEKIIGDPYTLEEMKRLKSVGRWCPRYGDRNQEIVLIGVYLDKPSIRAALETCLLTDKEYEAGPESWRKMPDPFCNGDAPKLYWDLSEDADKHSHDHAGHDHGH